MNMKTKPLRYAQEVPLTEHYQILIFKKTTIHTEGDQRSRDFPGHGYPASDDDYFFYEIYVYQNRQDWQDDIRKLYNENLNRTDIVAQHVKPANIGVNVNVDIG